MPVQHARHISLSESLATFVDQQVERGNYSSTSDLVRTAIRLLQSHEVLKGTSQDSASCASSHEVTSVDTLGAAMWFLEGGGEMGAQMRAYDWTLSPLGHPATWPEALGLSVSLMLSSGFPTCIIWGLDNSLVYNDAYREILGNKHPCALGQPLRIVWAEVWDLAGPLIARTMGGEAIFMEDLPAKLTRKGFVEETYFTFYYSPIRSVDGKVGGINCGLIETTDKILKIKHAEDLLADRNDFWSFTPNLIVVTDYAGILVDISPSWQATLGWSRQEMVGCPFMEFVHAEDADATAVEAASLLSDGATVSHFENRYRCKDGSYRTIAWTGSSARGRLYATGQDVTAVREREAELVIVQESLRQSQKMEAIGQLTGGIAHDFNNMLATITSSLELMNRRIASGKTGDLTRYLTMASTAAQSAAALIKRLLAFSRKQTLDLQTIEVNSLIAQMEDLLQRSTGENIQFVLSLQPDLPTVQSDRNQLENALLNLTINARDAMCGRGTIQIETSMRELDASYAAMHPEVMPGQYVMVSVSDDGTGMSPEVIAKAFEPFFTTKPIGQGTGLGLSMIYGFARQTQGHASIHSIVGKGTTVNIYLPCDLNTAKVSETLAQSVTRSPQGQGETVLFVEDEPGVRLVLAEILGELGYVTHEAIDATSAMAVAKSLSRLDLLISDVGLPGTNGRQLAEMMRAHRPDLKVLFITGYATNAAVKGEFLGRGMDMLAKPFTIDALAHKVQAMLAESAFRGASSDSIILDSAFGDLTS